MYFSDLYSHKKKWGAERRKTGRDAMDEVQRVTGECNKRPQSWKERCNKLYTFSPAATVTFDNGKPLITVHLYTQLAFAMSRKKENLPFYSKCWWLQLKEVINYKTDNKFNLKGMHLHGLPSVLYVYKARDFSCYMRAVPECYCCCWQV